MATKSAARQRTSHLKNGKPTLGKASANGQPRDVNKDVNKLSFNVGPETGRPIDHSRAPIVEALQDYLKKSTTSFGVPGHKAGKGATWDVMRLLGRHVYQSDASTQKGIDDRLESKKVMEQAEELVAHAWGACYARLSTNGTSLSNHVAMLAVANPGDKVLIARNVHKSLIAAIIGHVNPVFLEPDYDERWEIDHGVSAEEVERKLKENPDAKGVFVVSPTYYGVTPDLPRLAKICHKHQVPLIVDEAWGPHLPFHAEMPPAAIRSGADMALCSVHKTMAGLEQASILLLNSRFIPADRFTLTYDFFESTSPSVPILATIDATRRQFVQQGHKLLGKLLDLARQTREQLAGIDGVRVMGKEVLNNDSRYALEELKICFDVGDLGINGFRAEDWLLEQHHLAMGLCDRRNLLATFSVGTGRRDVDTLVSSIQKLADWVKKNKPDRKSKPDAMPPRKPLDTRLAMSPSEAYFAAAIHVPLKKAVGRVAAEMVSPYPPGIPVVLPGQKITEHHVNFLDAGRRAGIFALDPSDMALKSLRVVAE